MSQSEFSSSTTGLDEVWPADALTYHNNLAEFADIILAGYVQEICEAMPKKGPIVEIGSGNGRLGVLVPPQYRNRYIQTEIGEGNCQDARSKNPDLTTVCAKAQELPFAPEDVGGVLARNLFDIVDTEAVIDELERVVQPGGLVVHLRDHRPNLAWVQQHYPIDNTTQFIPYFDQYDDFMRYAIVPKEVLDRQATPQNQELLQAFTNPHHQEFISYNDAGLTDFKRLSRLLSSHAISITVQFTEIMDKKVGTLLKNAGFSPAFYYFKSEVDIPMDYAVQQGWDGAQNYLTNTRSYYNPEVPNDSVRIIQHIDAVTAVKS